MTSGSQGNHVPSNEALDVSLKATQARLRECSAEVAATTAMAQRHDRYVWLVLGIAAVFGVGATVLWGKLESAQTNAHDVKTALEKAQDEVETLRKEIAPDKLTERLSPLAERAISEATSSSLPVGTVVAWPGETEVAHGLPSGWATCDGASYRSKQAERQQWKVDALDAVLAGRYGESRLPDYRGYFLRGYIADGVNAMSKVANEARSPSAAIGSKQNYSTGKPSNEPLDPTGERLSPLVGRRILKFQENPGGLRVPHIASNDAGVSLQIHWDSETRPANVYVHWIIKVK